MLGQLPPNSGFSPNVKWNTDKLKASAYRCKKERSVAYKIGQTAFPVGTPLPYLFYVGAIAPKLRIFPKC